MKIFYKILFVIHLILVGLLLLIAPISIFLALMLIGFAADSPLANVFVGSVSVVNIWIIIYLLPLVLTIFSLIYIRNYLKTEQATYIEKIIIFIPFPLLLFFYLCIKLIFFIVK